MWPPKGTTELKGSTEERSEKRTRELFPRPYILNEGGHSRFGSVGGGRAWAVNIVSARRPLVSAVLRVRE